LFGAYCYAGRSFNKAYDLFIYRGGVSGYVRYIGRLIQFYASVNIYLVLRIGEIRPNEQAVNYPCAVYWRKSAEIQAANYLRTKQYNVFYICCFIVTSNSVPRCCGAKLEKYYAVIFNVLRRTYRIKGDRRHRFGNLPCTAYAFYYCGAAFVGCPPPYVLAANNLIRAYGKIGIVCVEAAVCE
jgi:hypothetical protein